MSKTTKKIPELTGKRLSLRSIARARAGDSDAMSAIRLHYEPYIRRAAILEAHGTSYLNMDLYERMKARLMWAAVNFRYSLPDESA